MRRNQKSGKKSLKLFILNVQDRSKSSMSVSSKRSSAVLVMISSKFVSVLNRFTLNKPSALKYRLFRR